MALRRRVDFSDCFGLRDMDEVWSNTVRRLEVQLGEYRLLKEKFASELDPAVLEEIRPVVTDAKGALDRKYSQLIAFAAGLSDDRVDFDTDLNVAAIVVSRRGNVSYIFGPESVSSTEPFFSPELNRFIADQLVANNPAATATAPGGILPDPTSIGLDAEGFAIRIAASHEINLVRNPADHSVIEKLADRVEAKYTDRPGSSGSVLLASVARSIEFTSCIERLRHVNDAESDTIRPTLPQADFEYLS